LLLGAGESPQAAVVELIALRDITRHEAELAVQIASGRRPRRSRPQLKHAAARVRPPRLYVPLRLL
jgi:hypothetical protein